jgi:DDE superfamily endonuclease
MWCVPELNREYVERMEDVLNLMEKPATEKEPVVALDERPVQLHATERNGRPMAPGRIAQRDYEYVRRGTANIFCIVAPKTGRHLTYATANRKARRFAAAMKRISDAYPDAKRIHIILDNLNTHRLKSLTDAYGEADGRRLWHRFVIHHTPKHGSRLNPVHLGKVDVDFTRLESTRARSAGDIPSMSSAGVTSIPVLSAPVRSRVHRVRSSSSEPDDRLPIPSFVPHAA